MIRAYLSELIVLILVVGVIGWGVVKFYFLINRESDVDYRERKRVQREADDAIDDLEHVVERAAKWQKPRAKK